MKKPNRLFKFLLNRIQPTPALPDNIVTKQELAEAMKEVDNAIAVGINKYDKNFNNNLLAHNMAMSKIEHLRMCLVSAHPAEDSMPGSEPKYKPIFNDDEREIVTAKLIEIIKTTC